MKPDAPRHWRQRIFALTWLSYFSYYLTRKPFSASKSSLPLSKSQLNWIDTTYNIAYCVGQVTNGFLVERIGPRRWIAIGMVASSVMCLAFLGVHSMSATLVGGYMLVWGINGFAQSTGWPSNGKAMGEWYGAAERGEVMGWWSTCYQAGGIAATLIAARMIAWFDWQATFIAPAIWVTVVGVAVLLWLRDRPSDVGFRDPDTADVDRDERRRIARLELRRLLATPMVWMLGLAYFACKAIRYAFIFWLPYFLNKVYGYSKETSLDISIALDVGGLIFVMLAGVVADRLLQRRRVLTAFGFLWALVGALFLYREVADLSPLVNVLTLGLVGGCLFAADSVISGAVAQDLGGPYASGLAAGLINGVGSIGQVLQGFALVWITGDDNSGWSTLFYVFMGLAAASACCLIPYLRVGPRTDLGPATTSTRG